MHRICTDQKGERIMNVSQVIHSQGEYGSRINTKFRRIVLPAIAGLSVIIVGLLAEFLSEQNIVHGSQAVAYTLPAKSETALSNPPAFAPRSQAASTHVPSRSRIHPFGDRTGMLTALGAVAISAIGLAIRIRKSRR